MLNKWTEPERRLEILMKESLPFSAMPPVRVAGVYLLLKNSCLHYVGRSSNIVSRIGAHMDDARVDFNGIRFIPFLVGDLTPLSESARLTPGDEIRKAHETSAFMESLLIHFIRPKFNRTVPSNAGVGLNGEAQIEHWKRNHGFEKSVYMLLGRAHLSAQNLYQQNKGIS